MVVQGKIRQLQQREHGDQTQDGKAAIRKQLNVIHTLNVAIGNTYNVAIGRLKQMAHTENSALVQICIEALVQDIYKTKSHTEQTPHGEIYSLWHKCYCDVSTKQTETPKNAQRMYCKQK